MRAEAIEAWTQLYAAVGLLAVICAGCAALKTILDAPRRCRRRPTYDVEAEVSLGSTSLVTVPA